MTLKGLIYYTPIIGIILLVATEVYYKDFPYTVPNVLLWALVQALSVCYILVNFIL